MFSPFRPVHIALLLLIAGAAACDKPQAMGDANAVIVVAPTDAWQQLAPAVESALEERTFTVRDERIFRVTHVDPAAEEWNTLRRFRQILVVGRADDPWMEPVMQRARPSASAPTVVEARDVWALNQLVTAVVLPAGADLGAASQLMPDVGTRFVERFHTYAVQRMYVSGVDSVLADSLRRTAGFSVLLPEIYYGRQLEPTTFVFRNDHPDPATLVRSMLITWRDGDHALDAAGVRQWREQVALRYYDPGQLTNEDILSRPLESDEQRGLQIQGVWSSAPGDWPAAGVFITRAIRCPQQNRTYLVDTWLYAPGREKYEYMLQLTTILNSFTCTAPVPA